LIKTPKLYWNDPAFVLHLGHSGGQAAPSGAHFENLVLCDLLAWREYPRDAIGAVVLHDGEESYWLDQKIIALPWWRVM
jgi:predicted AAA+ superfamily ATPase